MLVLRDVYWPLSVPINQRKTAIMRSSGVAPFCTSTNDAGCSPQYDGYSVSDTGERMNEGAVILLRSPDMLAIAFRKCIHPPRCSAGSASPCSVWVMLAV